MEQALQITEKKFYEPLRTDWVAQSGLSDADFMKEVSFALQHIAKNPLLLRCDQTSVLRSVQNLAQVGLTLNPISKYAYLIPRWSTKSNGFECVLEPDYRGLQKLLTDSGAVKSISCGIVFEGDEVEIDMASEQKVERHKPYWLNGKEKGKIVGVYSLATLADGSRHAEGMSYADVCDIRDRSESYKAYLNKKISTCIWVTDEPEMCRKTVIKRHYKYLPKSSATAKLEKAIELDNAIHGFDEPMDYGMAMFLEGLIYTSTLGEDERTKLTRQAAAFESKSQAFKLIDYLKEHQLEPGRDRTPHTIEEQGRAIREAVLKDDDHESRRK